jgi:hypothetical protein
MQEVSKEVVGIHVLQTRSLFGDGIPRRLPLHFSSTLNIEPYKAGWQRWYGTLPTEEQI